MPIVTKNQSHILENTWKLVGKYGEIEGKLVRDREEGEKNIESVKKKIYMIQAF